jgi:prolyl-tRNA synthetase
MKGFLPGGGLPEVITVASDSGMMGGNVSHEFMLPTPVGEDTIAVCQNCGYGANVEAVAIEYGVCPECGKKTLTISRSIEVGNIFQLGTKYTRAMNMQYTDENGDLQFPVMGCYGIGIGRLAASVCEARHDRSGPVWPMSIAPWQVHLCCLRSDDIETKTAADILYEELQNNGIEVIYDDRPVSAGVIFSDADLLGVPVRVIVSPRNVKIGCYEITSRDKRFNIKIPAVEVVGKVREICQNMLCLL